MYTIGKKSKVSMNGSTCHVVLAYSKMSVLIVDVDFTDITVAFSTNSPVPI